MVCKVSRLSGKCQSVLESFVDGIVSFLIAWWSGKCPKGHPTHPTLFLNYLESCLEVWNVFRLFEKLLGDMESFGMV